MVDLHFAILLLRCRLCLSSRVSSSFAKKSRGKEEENVFIFLLSLDAISGLECHSPALWFLRSGMSNRRFDVQNRERLCDKLDGV